MLTAGVDVGAENTKAVILEAGTILSYFVIQQSSETVQSVAQRALKEAMEKAGISSDDIEYLVATGDGSDRISFAHEQATEASCSARGASWLLPSTDTVIDMGAETCLVVKCQQGRPFNTVRNDRCASGTGRFLKMAAKPLGIDIEEMGRLSLQANEDLNISNMCAVFAESEIISLVHLKHRPEDIAKAVFKGLARRIYTMLIRVGFEKDLVMIGGVAKNIGMVKAMEEEAGCDILIPEEPMIVGALGAALIASERGNVSLKAQNGT